MRESVKAICILILLFGVPTAAVVGMDDRPSEMVWLARWISSGLSLVALSLFLWLTFQRDRARDFLWEQHGDYFNASGLGLVLRFAQRHGVLFIDIWYQNQYDSACQAELAITPGRGFWMSRHEIEEVIIPITCQPGEYGSASRPIAIPREYHGKRIEFELRADSVFPNGKGRRLRF